LPLLWLALRGLQEAGRWRRTRPASAGAVFAVVLGMGLVRILYRLFGTVLPRRRRLEALAAQYAGDSSGA
jgi:hypothetical protein